MTTTAIEIDLVIDALHEAGLSEDNLREEYSGRGMFGRTCLGITHDSIGQLLSFFAALSEQYARQGLWGEENYADTLARLAARARQDNMGLSTITYFPGFEVK